MLKNKKYNHSPFLSNKSSALFVVLCISVTNDRDLDTEKKF